MQITMAIVITILNALNCLQLLLIQLHFFFGFETLKPKDQQRVVSSFDNRNAANAENASKPIQKENPVPKFARIKDESEDDEEEDSGDEDYTGFSRIYANPEYKSDESEDDEEEDSGEEDAPKPKQAASCKRAAPSTAPKRAAPKAIPSPPKEVKRTPTVNTAVRKTLFSPALDQNNLYLPQSIASTQIKPVSDNKENHSFALNSLSTKYPKHTSFIDKFSQVAEAGNLSNSAEIESLLKKFQPVPQTAHLVTGALEAFEIDNDGLELLDTLERIDKTVGAIFAF